MERATCPDLPGKEGEPEEISSPGISPLPFQSPPRESKDAREEPIERSSRMTRDAVQSIPPSIRQPPKMMLAKMNNPSMMPMKTEQCSKIEFKNQHSILNEMKVLKGEK